MLSNYYSPNVDFTARPEVGLVTSETWVPVLVSINEVIGGSGWLLVQEKSDTEAKVLYSAVITKDIQVAFDERTRTIILRRPRTTLKEVNEYKFKFKDSLDFWNCLNSYIEARVPALTKATANQDSKTAKHGATTKDIVEAAPPAGLAKGIVEAAPLAGPMILGEMASAGQGGPIQGTGVGQVFRMDDLFVGMNIVNGQ